MNSYEQEMSDRMNNDPVNKHIRLAFIFIAFLILIANLLMVK